MKNADVLNYLFNVGKEVLAPTEVIELASNGRHKVYNIIQSIVVDNDDKENWFGLVFKDACIFKYGEKLITGADFYKPVTEINEVINRCMPIMEVIESPYNEIVRINFNAKLPIYPGVDLNNDCTVLADILFIDDASWEDCERSGQYTPKLYVSGNSYRWDHMYGSDTNSLSVDITKENSQYEEVKKFLNFFKENPNHQFGVVAKVTVLLKNTAK